MSLYLYSLLKEPKEYSSESSPFSINMETHDDLDLSVILNNSLADEDFAEELHLQEVIISSLINLHKSAAVSASEKLSTEFEIGESSSSSSKRSAFSASELLSGEIGESSSSSSKRSPSEELSRRLSVEASEISQSLCEICAETKGRGEMFPFERCSHAFCTDCVAKHVTIMIKKTLGEGSVAVTCPGVDCATVLEIDECRDYFPRSVIEEWGDVICESMIPPSQRFYCPYKGCSGMMVREGEAAVMAAECPFCNRLFCAECNVAWHGGVECDEYLRLKEEDEDEREREEAMVHDLAKEMKWKRCPNCNFYVERIDGCPHMTCRCGFQFCYSCGKKYSSTHLCS